MAAWQALLHAHDRLIKVLDAELRAEHGLSMGAYDVLLRLARAPGRRLPITEIARRVLISASAVSRTVDALEREGLVERHRGEEDARVVMAQLTDAGRDRVRAAARTHLRGIREHFTSRLTPEQLAAVGEALEVIAGPHVPH